MLTLKQCTVQIFYALFRDLTERAGREFSYGQKERAKDYFFEAYRDDLESIAGIEVNDKILEQLLRNRKETVDKLIKSVGATGLLNLTLQYPFELVLAKLAGASSLSVASRVVEMIKRGIELKLAQRPEAEEISRKIPPEFFGNFSLN